jgi:hypothetical protein
MKGSLERVLVVAVAIVAVTAGTSPPALAAAHAPSGGVALAAAVQAPGSPLALAAARAPRRARHSADRSAALASTQLWATIDVCQSGEQPIVGVRGSMPPDGHSHDLMYMRFGVQYLDGSTGRWAYLSKGAETSYTEVGAATATRQAGRNFHLASPEAGSSFRLRGVVEFEWRRAGKVVLSASKQTTSGHGTTVLHAQPSGFSSATCTVE